MWTIEDGAAATDAHMTGVISTAGGASMAKRGAGKVLLSGNSTPGNWTIEAGEVHVSGTTSGNLNITGGILSGTGNAGDVFGNIGAPRRSSPAVIPVLLSVGFFSPHPTTTLRFQINGTGRGTTYDSIDALNDTATIAGTLVLEIGGGFSPQRGQTFVLLHGNLADPPNGNFNGLAEGASFTQLAIAGTSPMWRTAGSTPSSPATASPPPASPASGTAAPAAIRAGPPRPTGRAISRPARPTSQATTEPEQGRIARIAPSTDVRGIM